MNISTKIHIVNPSRRVSQLKIRYLSPGTATISALKRMRPCLMSQGMSTIRKHSLKRSANTIISSLFKTHTIVADPH